MGLFVDKLTALAPDIWWPLIADASDASGHGVNGTATNVPMFGGANGTGPTFGEPSIGGSDGSVRFNGSRATRIEGALVGSHATFSSVMLVRFHGWAPENAAFGDHINSLLQIDAESNWMIRVRGNGTPADNVTEGDAAGGSIIPLSTAPTIDTLDQTYLVTMTWDGSTRRLYLDCDELANSAGSGPVNAGTIRLNWEFGDDRCSDAWYSDVAFLYRALTPTEVCDLADAVGEPSPPVPVETGRFALQRTIKQRRYPPITSTPAGNAHLDALAVSGAPQLVRTINGDTEATWQWTAPPDLDHAGLTPGLPLRIPTGPASAWHGQLDQPERDSNTLRGVGLWALAHDKLATADSGHPNAAAHTNECVDNAITDGLAWTRNQDLPNTSGFIQSGTMPLDEFLTTVADDLGEYPHVSDWGEIRIDPPPTDISYLLLATDAPPPTRNDYVTTFVVTYVDDVTLDVEIITVTNTAAAAKFGNIQRPLDLTGRGSMSAAHATSIGNGRLSKVRPRARWTDPFTVAPGQLLSPGGVAVDLGSARGFRLARLMLTDVARSSLVDMGVPSVVLIDKVEFDGSALAVYPVDTEGTRLRNLLARI